MAWTDRILFEKLPAHKCPKCNGAGQVETQEKTKKKGFFKKMFGGKKTPKKMVDCDVCETTRYVVYEIIPISYECAKRIIGADHKPVINNFEMVCRPATEAERTALNKY